MKWFNYLFLIPFIFLLTEGLIFFQTKNIKLKNQSNNFSKEVRLFKQTAEKMNINYQNLIFRPFINEIEFTNDNSTKIIFSTHKNLYTQFVVLQNLLKKANIIGKQISIVDFAQSHPYATFKNN